MITVKNIISNFKNNKFSGFYLNIIIAYNANIANIYAN